MFSNGAWAKIWKCEKGQGNYYVAQMSTSRKNQDGNYENDWSDGRVRLVGTAAKQAEKIKDGDRLQIENCGVTNTYDKEKKVTYTNYVIFAFSESGGEKKKNTKASPAKKVEVEEDEDLPFT